MHAPVCSFTTILLLTYLLTHGAEPFLRNRQLCSHSRISQHVMEPKGSITCSQEPSTDPYPEPYQSNPHQPILSKIHFNIVNSPTSWSSRWSLSFRLSHQYLLCIPLLPIRFTCLVQHIFLDLIILIILGGEYKFTC
jgi:hypothetical protein